MGQDRFTETTYTSYGQNIGNSFKGILIGLVMLVASVILLWWNEGRSVEQADALKDMQQQITTLQTPRYDAANNGKAVLVHGVVRPVHSVVDPEFGIKSNGLILRKHVQMYQWIEYKESESKDKLGGGTETVTTYTYSKEWSSIHQDSDFFKHPQGHQNPPLKHKSGTYVTDAILGDFHLSTSIVAYMGADMPYQGLSKMPKHIGDATNYGSYLYIGTNPETPHVGDTKITYTYAPAGEYTIAGAQSAKSIVPFTTANGKKLLFVRSGTMTAKEIFKEEFQSNTIITWMLRGVGLLLMYIGFMMVLGPLYVLAKVIPMLGSIMSGASSIVAAVLTLILGSIIIALAWFASRPMLSLGIIGVGVVIAIIVSRLGKNKTNHHNTRSTSNAQPSGTASHEPPRRQQSDSSGSTPPPRRER